MTAEPSPADPWANDRLDRQSTGEHLIKVLIDRYRARKANGSGSFIMNIDASWGEGKTFFLKCLRADLQRRGHAVAYVNAWQDDHADDPLVTVMAAIEDELAPFFATEEAAKKKMDSAKEALGIVAGETAKQVGVHLLKVVTGISVQSTMDKLHEQGFLKNYTVDDKSLDKASDKGWEAALKDIIPKRVSDHQEANKSAEQFRRDTAEAIEGIVGKGMMSPFFVFVDELDRCRPLYAIRLLEDLKHLFAIPGIIFVVATDSGQLAHSVKAIYGAEFEARKYLRRFFDQVYVFPEADRSKFVNHLLANFGIDQDAAFQKTGDRKPVDIFKSWADGLKLSNRDLEQCMEIIATFVFSWNHPNKIEPLYLLILVWLQYSSSSVDSRKNTLGQQAENSLANWTIKLQYVNSQGNTTHKEFTGVEIYKAASEIKSKRLVDVQSHYGDLYADVLDDERRSRFPSGIMRIAPDRSNLVEYSSRVRNAGRVIDT